MLSSTRPSGVDNDEDDGVDDDDAEDDDSINLDKMQLTITFDSFCVVDSLSLVVMLVDSETGDVNNDDDDEDVGDDGDKDDDEDDEDEDEDDDKHGS